MDINLTTYINQLGYGLVGLNVLKGLTNIGHTPALWLHGPGNAPEADKEIVMTALERATTYNLQAASLRIAHQWDMAQHVGRGSRFGMTFFEMNRLTQVEMHQLAALDGILVPSQWAQDILNAHGLRANHCVPMGVDMSIFNENVTPELPGASADLMAGLKERTVFFSCGKWEVRKGHDFLLDVFCKAFQPGDKVALVMNTFNPFLTQEEAAEWLRLYYESPMGSHVIIMKDRLVKQNSVAGLMALADCGLFPSRAEGWNLELLEMMAMGKAVIATNYAAHKEFCNASNCLLLDTPSLETAYDGKFFTTGFGEWAELGEQQAEQMVAYMRGVHDAKQNGRLWLNAAGVTTAQRFSWERCAASIGAILPEAGK